MADDISHYNYVYNYTDHLGNIRLSYTWDENEQALAILEENNYYPFGLKHSNYNFDQKQYEDSISGGVKIEDVVAGEAKYNYKYNGKEFQDELGLNLYDYKARNYDPALGRWMNIDPLAELSRRWSPYTYCYDNPLRYVDPDGMLAQSVIDDLWNKSTGEKTTWTFNEDGSASGSNGATVEAEPEQEDPPGFGHKPKEPTSKIGKFFNKIGKSFDKKKTAMANSFANDYERNDRLIMAYSFIMEALVETTEAGELLTYIRESMADTYGDENTKEVNEVYSNVISIVKQIKEDVGGGKITDGYVFQASAAFGAKAIGLQIKNEAIALTIKGLDKNVYYNRRIDPTQERDGGGFSGGGAGGKW